MEIFSKDKRCYMTNVKPTQVFFAFKNSMPKIDKKVFSQLLASVSTLITFPFRNV